MLAEFVKLNLLLAASRLIAVRYREEENKPDSPFSLEATKWHLVN